MRATYHPPIRPSHRPRLVVARHTGKAKLIGQPGNLSKRTGLLAFSNQDRSISIVPQAGPLWVPPGSVIIHQATISCTSPPWVAARNRYVLKSLYLKCRFQSTKSYREPRGVVARDLPLNGYWETTEHEGWASHNKGCRRPHAPVGASVERRGIFLWESSGEFRAILY